MSTCIRIEGLTHTFRGTTALDHLDLELGVGVTGLLGPNGAGKTTLLRIVATVLRPDAGQVRVLGNDPTADPRQLTAIRRNLGYVPQELGFPRGFTAFGFVDYLAVLKEWAERGARHAEVRRVLELVDLADRSTKRIRALSGGQRRRLAVAQALLGDPRILLLDEPTAGLDPQQRAGLRAVLSAAGERATVLLSTHQTEDVSALCDRVVVLDGGRIRFNGAVTDLVATAEGRVWLANSPDPAAQASWRTGTGRYRHVGDAPPGSELVEPSLEDAYLLLVGGPAGAAEVAA